MKHKTEHVRALLSQALVMTDSDPIKYRIRETIQAVDKEAKKEAKRKQQNDISAQWWGNVQAGVAKLSVAKMTPVGYAKSLKELNAQIEAEKNKIDELERQSQTQASNGMLLQE